MALNPHHTFGVAKGYVQSAYSMMTNPLRIQQFNDDTTFFMAFHMLCGFAVELYLKAFLAHKGYSEAQLRKPDTRHDLERLRDSCRSEGFYHSGGDSLVQLLAEKHKSFEFRYMKPDGEYRAMHLDAMFALFSSLDCEIDAAIGASAAYGLAPGRDGWKFPSDGPWRLPMDTSKK